MSDERKQESRVSDDRGRSAVGATPARGKFFRWGFLSASALILALVLAGQVALSVLGLVVQGAATPLQTAAFGGFVLATGVFLVIQREGVLRFFRTMHVGVTLVTLSLVAVGVGVLVPQITGFEDPTERVPDVRDIPRDVFEAYVPAPKMKSDEDFKRRPDDHPALASLTSEQVSRLKKWKYEYATFRWAEGFFVYHMLHLYGLGMPEATMPVGIEEKLDRFEDRYGTEERDNREKTMTAAFTGRMKSQEIGDLIRANEPTFRRAFEICTALDLNRTYKSNWFATLLGLLFCGVLSNTFKGGPAKWFTLEKGGYMLVHLGVLTLLGGDGVYLVSRVIDGSFPDYKQIIPKEYKTEVVLLKQDLLSALKLGNVFSDTFNQIILRVVPGEKLFEITTKNTTVGENHNVLETVLKGEDITISFNYKYIIDCFQSIKSDSLALSFSGLGKPLLVKGVSDRSFLYIVMPMNK